MNRKFIPYEPRLKILAQQLRKNLTVSEIMLWQQLKGKNVFGLDFHRQRPIDKYIVDFYCPKLMLAIEIDGITHAGREAEDRRRQERLESLGVRMLRFQDSDVSSNLLGVMAVISEWITRHTPSHQPQNGV